MFKGYTEHWAESTKPAKHGLSSHAVFLAISFILLYFFPGFISASDDNNK